MKLVLIDCGRATRQTKGNWFGFTLELSTPPTNKQYPF